MNRLKRLRTERKLSQKELSIILNCAQNTVSQWENGTREMDAPVLKKLSEFFFCFYGLYIRNYKY